VLLLRKLQGWAPQGAFSEYWGLQLANNFSPPSITEIEKTTKDIEKFATEVTEVMSNVFMSSLSPLFRLTMTFFVAV
jgi:hypothetical protein